MPCADLRVSLDITVQRWCFIDGKRTPCAQFAGPRPWPQFGQLVESTAVGVYNGSQNKASLNFRINKFAPLPLILQDIAVIAVVACLLFSLCVLGLCLIPWSWWQHWQTLEVPQGLTPSLFVGTLLNDFAAFTTRVFFRLTAGNLLAGVVWEGLNCVLPPLRYFSEIPW